MAETSPLRRRMIEDMTVRNLSPATQRSCVHAVSKFSRFFGRSPETLTLEDVRTCQVHLASKGVAWASLNQTAAALRFFCGVTLGMAEIPERIAYAREPRRLPVVLSADEVVRLLEAVPSLKARAALTTAYAAGLRVSEVTGLKVADIVPEARLRHDDSDRMMIRIEHGKGGKERYVMLSAQLLAILRTYWRLARPGPWLFPGRDATRAQGASRADGQLLRPLTEAFDPEERSEPVQVEAFVAELAVQALDEGVLHGLARFDEAQAHAGPLRLVEHGAAGSFGTVVEDDLLGQSVQQRQIVEIPRHPCAGDRDVDDLAGAEPAVVVDDVQHPEAAAVGQLVADEFERPAPHRPFRDLRCDAVAPGQLAPRPGPHLQAHLGVEAAGALAVRHQPLPPQHRVQPELAVAAVLRGQLLHGARHCRVVLRRGRVLLHRARQADDPAAPPSAETQRVHKKSPRLVSWPLA